MNSHAHAGLIALLTGRSAGGLMARWLLPAVVAAPLVLSWLYLRGEHAGLDGKDLGIIILTVLLIAASALLVCRNTAASERADVRLRRSEEQAPHKLQRRSVLLQEAEEARRGLEEDIAARRRTEIELRESEEKFRALAETAPGAIVSCDRRGNLIFFNKSAQDIFRYGASEIIGRPLTLLIPERLHAAHDKAFLEGSLIGKTFETVGRRKQGSEFPLEMSLSAWNAGNQQFLAAFIRDITEQKLAEEHVRQLNESLTSQVAGLQVANKELEAFSYSVSHDLRAPLRGIEGFSKILVEEHGCRLDSEGKRILEIIRNNTRQMGKLIDDLLAFSRLTSVEFEKSPINMAALARSAVDELMEAQNAPVQVVIRPLIPAVGNASLIFQVFVNLISNAFKFARNRPHPRVEIGCEIRENENVYYVKDNGVGFEMEYADKLFGVFQRLHSAAQFEGTGVGLAIVKRVVTRHGGRVWAEAKPNREATFYFSLPAEGKPSFRMQA